MKTSELIGPTLDWAVAKCEGAKNLRQNPHRFDDRLLIQMANRPEHFDTFRFSTDWAQGGPIIEREAITLSAYCGKGDSVDWYAGRYSLKSPTPLIAAMRCYVASKLGDEVEIPEELL